jgi:DNA-binding CsgD family transcriptional regulator/tetratricopeptide (TPR) repeat protein
VTLQWGLVGRGEELELLRAALSDVGTRGAVLSGAPGVGKTRLAAELLKHAADQGWATQWTVGTRAVASVPFGAFAHLLSAGEDTASSSPDALRRARDELRRRVGDRPLALGVDDAHLLDEASARLTHLLAVGAHAFVVATVRRGERTPDAISALWQDGLAERVEVQALSRMEVGHLLGIVLGGQVDTATRHRLWNASRGNVLFLHELVLIGLERGSLAERAGVWSWVGELACGDRLTELVEDRLVGLDWQQRTALEVLALGEPLPSSVFSSVVGSRVVQELHRRGLLTVLPQGRRHTLRLAHPLYAETMRAGLGGMRRRTIYRLLADALAATGLHRREDALRASLWRLEGGGPNDVTMLMAGARWARAMSEHRLAERLARAAIDEGCGTDAWIVLANALYRQGRYREALSAVGDCLPPDAGAAVAVEWAIIASSIFFWGLGDAGRAEEIMRQAEQAVAPGADRDLLVAHRAILAFFHGRPADALFAVEPVLTRTSPSDEVVMRARIAAVPALSVRGRSDAALQLADEGMQAGVRLMDERPLLVSELLAMQAMACWMAGRYRQMEDMATAAYQHVVAEKAHDLRGLWAMLLGRAALAAGRAATARQRLREACTLFRQQDPDGLLPWALGCAARAAALLGDVEDAQRALAEQHRSQLSAVRVFESEAVLAQAWTAVAQGEHSAARSLACRAADVAAAAGLRSAELEALHDAVRLGETRVQPRLAALAAEMDSVLAPVLGGHAAALVTGDADALDRWAARFAELGAPLLAAEAAAEAAERHHRAGHTAARLAAQERSQTLASICEGAQTPSLRRAGVPPTFEPLTARELEIAELAARGLPKREIADRLLLSVRTVGNHLNHIYTKAGISGRAELALFLGLDAVPVG